jgi:hypothetical protein
VRQLISVCAGCAVIWLAAGATDRAAAARWVPVTLPLDGQLEGVSCASPRACMAVGTRIVSPTVQATLAEHWNGRGWSVQATPSPAYSPPAGETSVTGPQLGVVEK